MLVAIMVFLSLISLPVFGEQKAVWVFFDQLGSQPVTAIAPGASAAAVPSGSRALPVPVGFVPLGRAANYLEGSLCPGCGEGEESEYAVVGLDGKVVFRSEVRWSLARRGDAVITIVKLPEDRETQELLRLPSGPGKDFTGFLVQSCPLPSGPCATDAVASSADAVLNYAALGFRDVVALLHGQEGSEIVRVKDGKILWKRSVPDLLNPLIWDVHLGRNELLLGSRPEGAVRVFDLANGSETFRWDLPLVAGELALRGISPEKECIPTHAGAILGRQGLSRPEGYPENWHLWSGWARLFSGTLLAGGDIVLLGEESAPGVGVACRGDAKIFLLARRKPEAPRFFSLAQVAQGVPCRHLWARRVEWDERASRGYLICEEGSAVLDLPPEPSR